MIKGKIKSVLLHKINITVKMTERNIDLSTQKMTEGN